MKGDAFRVAYVGDDARTVMKVTERLASLFVEENLRDREVLAEGTNQFLEAQLPARGRLVQHEKKLEAYRQHVLVSFRRRSHRTFKPFRTSRCRFRPLSSRSTAIATGAC